MSGSSRRNNTAPTPRGGAGSVGSLAALSPRRSLTLEEASYAAAQELVNVMSAPSSSNSWLTAWPFTGVGEDADAKPPPLPAGTLPEITLQDFSRYLRSVGERLESFERSREASQQRMQQSLSPGELRASQGQGLVAAMKEVPAAFFQEAFDIDQRQLWEEVVQVESEEARQASLDRLSSYLDTVETHLVREIAARTDNFFDASGYIQDVRGSVAQLYQQVAVLRQQMHGLEQETAQAVETAQRLRRRHANLTVTLDTLHAMEGVSQAQAALQGLLPCSGGVAVDYGGAIDVLEVLQGVLDDEALLGLDCFSHLPEQIVETAEAVDDLMTSDFLERTRFAAQGAILGCIRDRLGAQMAAQAAAEAAAGTPRRRQSASLTPSRQLSAEESAELEALAAVKLDSIAALERTVGWLESATGRGAGSSASEVPLNSADQALPAGTDQPSLQDVLLPLVLGLQRMGRLPATMRDLKDTATARLKELLSQVIDGCLAVLDPEAALGDSSHLVAGQRATSPSREPPGSLEKLQRLPGQDFNWVLEAALLAVHAYLRHCTAVGEAVQRILSAAKASKQQLAAAAQDATQCRHAAAEAAVARWAKLLGGRARVTGEGGGGGMRLPDLQRTLQLTDLLAALVEGHGMKGAVGLRGALQQLCKSALDDLHSRSLAKLTSLLEQEQWSAVEVAPTFQHIVDALQQQAAELGGAGGTSAAAAAAAARPSEQQTAAAPAAGGHGAEHSNGVASGSAEANGSVPPSAADGDSAAAGALPTGAPRKFTITPHDGSGGPPAAGAAVAALVAAAAGPAQQAPSEPPAKVLVVAGQPYHVVNTQLLLLSMLRDYLAFRSAVPAFAAEVAQRVLELLKVFNSRTCQLVLGAGAMQVSGLKSITAKHLAISCQCLGAFMALHPSLLALFTWGVPHPRAGMLTQDFGRALQDYCIHHEEVCSKLVSIMRERLSLNIKQLPAQAAAWPSGAERPELPAPSHFAATCAKQLTILAGALTPLLLPAEVHGIFGRIGVMFSATLAEAYDLLEPHGPAWEQQLRADVQFLLNCLRNLPMDPSERDANLERLTRLFEQRFLGLPPPAAPAATVPAGQQPAGQAAAVQTAAPSVQPAAGRAASQPAAGSAVQQPGVPQGSQLAAATLHKDPKTTDAHLAMPSPMQQALAAEHPADDAADMGPAAGALSPPATAAAAEVAEQSDRKIGAAEQAAEQAMQPGHLLLQQLGEGGDGHPQVQQQQQEQELNGQQAAEDADEKQQPSSTTLQEGQQKQQPEVDHPLALAAGGQAEARPP